MWRDSIFPNGGIVLPEGPYGGGSAERLCQAAVDGGPGYGDHSLDLPRRGQIHHLQKDGDPDDGNHRNQGDRRTVHHNHQRT